MSGVNVVRDGGGPLSATALPTSGGSQIYCASDRRDNGALVPALVEPHAAIEITLEQRSTLNIQIVWDAPGEDFMRGWNISPYRLDSLEVAAQAAPSYVGANTLEAGTWTIHAYLDAEVPAGYSATVFLVVIVGVNTEANCDADFGWPPIDSLSLVPIGEIDVGASYTIIPWEGEGIGFDTTDGGETWDGARPFGYPFFINVLFHDQWIVGTRFARVTALPSGEQFEMEGDVIDGWNTQINFSDVAPEGTSGFFVEVKSSEPGVTIDSTSLSSSTSFQV